MAAAAYLPRATKYMPTITGQVIYKSLSNCCDTLHVFNVSYAVWIVSPDKFRPIGKHRCNTGVLKITDQSTKSVKMSHKVLCQLWTTVTFRKPGRLDTVPTHWNIACQEVLVLPTATYWNHIGTIDCPFPDRIYTILLCRPAVLLDNASRTLWPYFSILWCPERVHSVCQWYLNRTISYRKNVHFRERHTYCQMSRIR